LPFDELKVDRAFVSGATHDTVARTILRSSIELGHALGLTVVAEGIETGGDQILLAALGCDEMQGYYFSRPCCRLNSWRGSKPFMRDRSVYANDPVR
jgi:EAL domain-containing protein (putative c-di-GMP-specific phosphodiesterase class I)